MLKKTSLFNIYEIFMASGLVHKFIEEQLQDWDLAAVNYSALKDVRTKSVPFDNYEIIVQFNPKRIISSSAKVDAKTIESRPCFLCSKNLPARQRSLPFKEDYLILINPFPIFNRHLTIPKLNHTDQRIKGNFTDMLDLCRYLDEFTIIYNGPKSGASAPDHFHFQAGNKGFMPIEKDFAKKSHCKVISQTVHSTIYSWVDYMRGAVTIESKDKGILAEWFDHFLLIFTRLQPWEPEPLLNIISWYSVDSWVVSLFPRKIHRPKQYFEKGEKQILLSPASVDLGGTLITPREEDFKKITKADIEDIFAQVCLGEDAITDIMNEI